MDEPNKWVLVHGVNAGQVLYGEEQNAAVLSHRFVAIPDLINFCLSFWGDLLLLIDFFWQYFAGGQDLNCRLIFQDVTLLNREILKILSLNYIVSREKCIYDDHILITSR